MEDPHAELEGPPEDANDWSDEQWIAWLKSTDPDRPTDHDGTATTVASRVVHSRGGQLLGQSMMGLARALYGQPDDKPAIVSDANSDPEDDQPFTLHLDHEHPERSIAIRNSRRAANSPDEHPTVDATTDDQSPDNQRPDDQPSPH